MRGLQELRAAHPHLTTNGPCPDRHRPTRLVSRPAWIEGFESRSRSAIQEVEMADVTVASFEEMEPIYEGLARRARATLGVTSFGMQVMTLPPNWDGYPK